MRIQYMEEPEYNQNVYALNAKDEEIYILDAKSGKQGYFCMGCKREMQAVKQSKENRRSYFRHDHNALKGEGLCTYSDETHRHKIAKQYLINLKRVKVPSVYKFPPKDVSGIANLISKEKYIEASFVIPELSFYEDDDGVIHYEKVFPSTDNYKLLIKPDITFFDNQSKPILLIELVATHRLTEEKKLKIKQLGIDCIQVTIPRDSPENIEKVFERTNRTKWIYNYEHEIAEYIPTAIGDSEGLSFVDKDQRKFFEESYTCRAAQIGNLIRSINRCVASESYGKIVGNLESEISRVTRNTETARESLEKSRGTNARSLEKLRAGIRAKVNARYQVSIDRIHSERARIEAEEQQFQEFISKEEAEYASEIEEHRDRIGKDISGESGNDKKERERRYTDLEKRYLARRAELIGQRKRLQDSNGELRDQISRIERDYNREQATNIGIRTKRYQIDDTIKESERIENQERSALEGIIETRNNIDGRRSKTRVEIEERAGRERKELEERIEQLRRGFIAAIKGREFEGNEYTKRYKEQIVDLERIPDYIDAKRAYERNEKAWKCFKDGAYENWHD